MKSAITFPIVFTAGLVILQGAPAFGQANSQLQPRPARPQRPPGQSPASAPRPKSATPQDYSAAQVREGEVQFGSQCGFCHGKDAAGGESGPDLTRSEVVAKDMRGNQLGPVIRAGRPEKGMPAFNKLSETELNAIVAFVHSQMDKFAELGGGRRSVLPEDLATGNGEAGRAYFQGAGGCSSCHSEAGDLAGIGKRYQGLNLLRRILYPGGGPGMAQSAAQPKATIVLQSGQTVAAPVVAEDDFSVTVLDASGGRQTYQRNAVQVKVEDPLSAHFNLLGKYTDTDIHNLYAYLEGLK